MRSDLNAASTDTVGILGVVLEEMDFFKILGVVGVFFIEIHLE